MASDPGEVEKDEEGIKTMKDLGVNMAWLLKKLTGLAGCNSLGSNLCGLFLKYTGGHIGKTVGPSLPPGT